MGKDPRCLREKTMNERLHDANLALAGSVSGSAPALICINRHPQLAQYRTLCADLNLGLNWESSTADLGLLEQKVLTRNDYQQGDELWGNFVCQDEKHAGGDTVLPVHTIPPQPLLVVGLTVALTACGHLTRPDATLN